jgi:hypothetical protein
MTRIQLRLYMNPGEAEITVAIKLPDNTYERITGKVDTGAEISLLPDDILTKLAPIPAEEHQIFTVEQAGIANQSFQVEERQITMILEDQFGNETQPFVARVWFGETEIALIGFQDILECALLHIDMPQRTGWLEIDA